LVPTKSVRRFVGWSPKGAPADVKKKKGGPLPKREERKERKERKGNHGCFSRHRTSQGASDRLHNAEKRISTKTHNRLGDQVKQELAEVKMSMIRKRDLSGHRRD
jgi:hypothetical protein